MTGLAGRGGLPNTVVIPQRWSAHQVSTAEGQLTAECVIFRSGGAPVFDELMGRSIPTDPTTVYSGGCRLSRLGTDQQQVPVADRAVSIGDYRITVVAAAADIRVDDWVKMTACPDDERIVGAVLRIRAVQFSSLRAQRDLVCELVGNTNR